MKNLPLTLVLKCKHEGATKEAIGKEFENELGEYAQRGTIDSYTVDPEPYYHAYYGAGDNRFGPRTIVKVRYTLT